VNYEKKKFEEKNPYKQIYKRIYNSLYFVLAVESLRTADPRKTNILIHRPREIDRERDEQLITS